MDRDKDDLLSLKEFLLVLKRVFGKAMQAKKYSRGKFGRKKASNANLHGKPSQKPRNKKTRLTFPVDLLPVLSAGQQSVVDSMFNSLDEDGSGHVTGDEFLNHL